MSLSTNVSDLATRVATEVKALRTLINSNAADLSALDTTNKTSLVAAINELAAAIGGAGAVIDDVTISTLTVWSSDKTNDEIVAAVAALVGGAPGALDTLNELAAAINDDASYAASITTALGLKANDADVVHDTGNETIAGTKTFSSAPSVPDGSFTIAKTTGLQGALDLKAPLASPAFTGTVSGVTKAHVGLGNVDNTADSAKPVSTAQQTALDLKANLASPTFTGTPAAPTATGGTSTTQVATTAMVQAAITARAATETAAGIVELATTAEATTGSDTVRAVTPAGLKVVADTKITAFADPGADRIVFWDDSANAWAPLSPVAPVTISGTSLSVAAASATVAGVVELATTAEATTGTDSTRAVTPEGLKTVADTKANTADVGSTTTNYVTVFEAGLV